MFQAYEGYNFGSVTYSHGLYDSSADDKGGFIEC